MALSFALNLIAKYKTSGLLLDTNLLLVVAVGNYDERRLLSFKRTRQFTVEDFHLLQRIIGEFSTLWTTPNIMTEVDNLGRQLESREWEPFAISMRQLSIRLVEVSEPSQNVTKDSRYAKLGLADSVTLAKLKERLLLTDDLKLQGIATHAGFDVINFNNLRQFES